MKQSPPSYRGADCHLIPRALASNARLPYSRKMRDMIRHPVFGNGKGFLTYAFSFDKSEWVDMAGGVSKWIKGRDMILANAMNSLEYVDVAHFEVRFSRSDRMLGWYAIALNHDH
jgi:hypothetical protein